MRLLRNVSQREQRETFFCDGCTKVMGSATQDQTQQASLESENWIESGI
jgi:hypothetical protein